MYKAYTGIGSRKTPDNICQLMTQLGTKLEGLGYTLRSGHADKADKAFEAGVSRSWLKEIYLPWPSFNGSKSLLNDPSLEAFEMAESFHPNWSACSRGAKALHARNCHQVLGDKLNEASEFVCCWTEDGKASGGTGQAMRIAEYYGIPVFNMHDPENIRRITEFVKG
jgi:hypothetical protein